MDTTSFSTILRRLSGEYVPLVVFHLYWIEHWNQDPKALKTIKGKVNPNFDPNELQRRIDDWERAEKEKEIYYKNNF